MRLRRAWAQGKRYSVAVDNVSDRTLGGSRHRVIRRSAPTATRTMTSGRQLVGGTLAASRLDAFGRKNKALDFVLTKAGLLDVAKQIHDLGLVVKKADNFGVRG